MDSRQKRVQEIIDEKIREALETEVVELEEDCWKQRRADFKAEWEQKILDQRIREGMNTRSIPVEEGHWERLCERLNRMADERLEEDIQKGLDQYERGEYNALDMAEFKKKARERFARKSETA
ncbi:MAG: hypothetical protein KC964_11085 [Candidatus Omnitrophica bacterium]|nr:hypothetical protein [Candidatus Omnitrophota bacterium]